MLARVHSAAVSGIDARVLDVEVDVSDGLPCFTIVGLPDTSVREALVHRTLSVDRRSGSRLTDLAEQTATAGTRRPARRADALPCPTWLLVERCYPKSARASWPGWAASLARCRSRSSGGGSKPPA